MPKCTYCGKNYEWPVGLTLVDIVGKTKYFCSSKCRKYTMMNRKKGKWAEKSGKETAVAAEKKLAEKR